MINIPIIKNVLIINVANGKCSIVFSGIIIGKITIAKAGGNLKFKKNNNDETIIKSIKLANKKLLRYLIVKQPMMLDIKSAKIRFNRTFNFSDGLFNDSKATTITGGIAA